MIFIHIPKTGGTSIEYVLGMHGDKNNIGIEPYENQKKNYQALFGKGLQHLTCKEVFTILSRRLNSETGFGNKLKEGLGRMLSGPNPDYDKISKRLLDEYYVFSIVRNPYDRLVSEIAWTAGRWKAREQLDFELFRERVIDILTMPAKKIPERYKPQHDYVLIDGKKYMHDVFHYENLRTIAETLKEKVGISEDIPHRMRSNHGSWENYYNPDLRELVYNHYKMDFELFGYDR